MSAGWRIVPAAEALAHLPMLARWHHAEWAPLFPGWTEDDALAELRASAHATVDDVDVSTHADAVPMTLVALRSPATPAAISASGHDADLLGSISLIAEDSPELRAFDGPWLASLFVAPAARGRGLGEALVRALVAHAARSGLARIRLFTPKHRAFYERLGWRFDARASSGGEAVDVMSIALTLGNVVSSR